jgi:hypothetical protein
MGEDSPQNLGNKLLNELVEVSPLMAFSCLFVSLPETELSAQIGKDARQGLRYRLTPSQPRRYRYGPVPRRQLNPTSSVTASGSRYAPPIPQRVNGVN